MGTLSDLDKKRVEHVEEYMDAAIVAIEKKFGDGYACKHPELVAGFIQAIALDNIDIGLVDLNSTLIDIEQKM